MPPTCDVVSLWCPPTAAQDWSSRYNRYRTFLRTERDRCTTLTMDQLLRAFLQKEQQEDAGRRCGLEVSLARGAWLLTRQ